MFIVQVNRPCVRGVRAASPIVDGAVYPARWIESDRCAEYLFQDLARRLPHFRVSLIHRLQEKRDRALASLCQLGRRRFPVRCAQLIDQPMHPFLFDERNESTRPAPPFPQAEVAASRAIGQSRRR